MIRIIISTFLTTAAFAILFNVRGKKVVYASFIGMCSGVIFYSLLDTHVNVVIAQFIASLTLTSLSEIFARKVKTPVTTFIVCALIPLVPGGGMYLSMKAMMENDIAKGESILLDVLAQSGALALGIVVVSTFSFVYRNYTLKRKGKL